MLVLVSSCAKVRGGNGANPCRVQETSKQFIQQCSVAPAPVLTQGVALKPKASIVSLPVGTYDWRLSLHDIPNLVGRVVQNLFR